MHHNHYDTCPECNSHVMHVPSTGLIACVAAIKFGQCRWHVRVKPWSESVKRRATMTEKDKRLLREQEEINRRIANASNR